MLFVDFLCVCVFTPPQRDTHDWMLNTKNHYSLMRIISPILFLILKKEIKSGMQSFKCLCLCKYYRKDRIGLLLNPYLLIIYSRKKQQKSKSFLTQQWILQLWSEFLLSHPKFSIFWWALVKQTRFLIANLACFWWDLKIKLGLFHWSPATKIRNPNFAPCNFNCFEGMAGIKSRR